VTIVFFINFAITSNFLLANTIEYRSFFFFFRRNKQVRLAGPLLISVAWKRSLENFEAEQRLEELQ